jgi:transaldolase
MTRYDAQTKETAYSSLDKLKATGTIIVADTGDINAIKEHKPQDATTNPSLINKLAGCDEFNYLFEEAVAYGCVHGKNEDEQVQYAMDKLFVNVGVEILDIVPGRVSTEVDAAHSYDTKATLNHAKRLIALYKSAGIPRERVLVKVGATWEGIQAVQELEKEGIYTNATLIFNPTQALGVAQAGGTLVSPFVGRTSDAYKKVRGVVSFPVDEDPGVKLVVDTYNSFRQHGYDTVVMGASFRTVDQVLALAGSDLLTISPILLAELNTMNRDVPRVLSPTLAQTSAIYGGLVDKEHFDNVFRTDTVALDLLKDGIRRFDEDTRKLETRIRGIIRTMSS